MCLGIPALVLEIAGGNTARVDLGGLETVVRTDLVPGVKTGQYVIVHAGFAINVLDEREAEVTLKLLESIDAFGKIPEP
jgi:hydrogenase expression/formation protein HypC